MVNEQRFRGMSVLVVDDQELFLRAMLLDLQDLGFAVTTAMHGEEGYQKAIEGSFDLILSDVKMPVWDGRRFLQEYRLHSRTTPFALMTGFSDFSIEQAFDLGADAYLGKPSSPELLEETFAALLAPESQRWLLADKLSPKAHLKINLQGWAAGFGHGWAFGRRGIYLDIDGQELKWGVGDELEIELNFSDGPVGTLRGTGRVTWADKQFHKTSRMGITFIAIQESARVPLIEHLKSLNPIASIPAGPRKAIPS